MYRCMNFEHGAHTYTSTVRCSRRAYRHCCTSETDCVKSTSLLLTVERLQLRWMNWSDQKVKRPWPPQPLRFRRPCTKRTSERGATSPSTHFLLTLQFLLLSVLLLTCFSSSVQLYGLIFLLCFKYSSSNAFTISIVKFNFDLFFYYMWPCYCLLVIYLLQCGFTKVVE